MLYVTEAKYNDYSSLSIVTMIKSQGGRILPPMGEFWEKMRSLTLDPDDLTHGDRYGIKRCPPNLTWQIIGMENQMAAFKHMLLDYIDDASSPTFPEFIGTCAEMENIASGLRSRIGQ